jgi:hypothetical protein
MQRISENAPPPPAAPRPTLTNTVSPLLPWVATILSLLVFGIVAGMVVQVSFGTR